MKEEHKSSGSNARDSRSAFRNRDTADSSNFRDYGFRLVREVD